MSSVTHTCTITVRTHIAQQIDALFLSISLSDTDTFTDTDTETDEMPYAETEDKTATLIREKFN